MSRVPVFPWLRGRFAALALILIALNVGGLLLIRAEMLARPALRLRVMSFSPDRNYDAADRLSLVFDEALAMPERIGEPLAQSPFVIDPAPPGHWEYAADGRRLDYVLAQPLPPGRKWAIRPTADFTAQLGRELVGDSEWTFATRPLRVDACRLESADEEHANIELVFNQPVSPIDLRDRLSAIGSLTQRTLQFDVLEVEPRPTLTVRCERPGEGGVRVYIEPELTGDGGELGLPAPWTGVVPMPTRFTFLNASVHSWGFAGRASYIEFRFSSPLDREQQTPAIDLAPAAEITSTRIERNRLVVTGDFAPGIEYQASLPATLVSEEAKTLGETIVASFRMPDYSPQIQFPLSRGILTPHGNLELEFEAVNVPGVAFSRSRLHANNIVEHVRGSGMQKTSRSLAKKTVVLDNRRNEPFEGAVDLRALLSDGAESVPLGVYAISARSTGESWGLDYATITITDLSIVTRTGRDGLLVWVNSLRHGRPLEGVTIRAHSYNNQVLAEASTDPDGLAFLPIAANHPDGPVFIITAEKGSDLSFIEPARQAVVLDDVAQDGRAIPQAYDIMLYTERGVYRPGDAIHLTGIIRDHAGAVPPSFPVEVIVERPDGRVVETQIVHPEEAQGTFHLDIVTLEDGQTGRYRMTASLPGSSDEIGRADAWVEAFEPVRLEVNAEPGAARYVGDAVPSIEVNARYLFGQPASNLDVSLNAQYRSIVHVSERYPGFMFGNGTEETQRRIKEVESALNTNGGATFELTERTATGLSRASVSATVTELGGRSVSTYTSFIVDPINRHLGLHIPAGTVVPTDQEIEVRWAFVDGEDADIDNDVLRATLEQITHHWILKEVNGRRTWASIEEATTVQEITIDAQDAAARDGVIRTICPHAGEYRVSLKEESSGALAELRFHASPYAESAQRLAMKSPERLDMILDREKYSPGETAELLIRSPFPGMLLLTMESDRVHERRVIEMKETAQRIELPVAGDWRANVYIAATLIRTVDPAATDWLPHRAAGLVRLSIDHAPHIREIEIDAPDRAYPNESVQVVVRSEPTSHERTALVHLWAVDEGILLTSAFETPNPLDHFLAMRRLETEGADLHADLLPDFSRPADLLRIGGDDGDAVSRRNPVPAKRSDAAIVWSGFRPLEEDGTVAINFIVPELQGALRIMAVVVDGDRYGSAEHEIAVAQDVIIETNWPRAVAAGDSFTAPVKIINTLDRAVHVAPSLDLPENLEVANALPETLELAAGETRTFRLHVTAIENGACTTRIAARYDTGESSREVVASSNFTVRPIAPLHSEWRFVRVEAGERAELAPIDSVHPEGSVTTITIAPTPAVELTGALSQLIDYPYGCVEQTVSRLWALLHAPEVFEIAAGSPGQAEYVRDMIRAGIARLWSMQTRSGGLSYWPGGSASSPWGSAYAAHFLVEAQRAGYEIDPTFAKSLARYLDERLAARDEESSDPNTRALICRVLSMFSDGARVPAGHIAWLSENVQQLDLAGRAHLAGALIEIGRRDRALELFDDSDSALAVVVHSSTSGRLAAPSQQDAVLLSLLLDLDPAHALIAPLAARLNEARTRQGDWGTTLSNAVAISALAKYQALSNSEPSDYRGVVHIGDESLPFDHTAAFSITRRDLGAPMTIESEGSGTLHITQSVEGVSRDPALAEYDRQLRVRRTYLSDTGEPIDHESIRVGDLVQVEVSIALEPVAGIQSIHNVAIVDLLPGCFEVEHPRLRTSAGEERTDTAEADRAEFLDDRVIIFTSVGQTPRTYRYALRAIAAGTFAAPAIQASCMYDPAFASVSGGGAGATFICAE